MKKLILLAIAIACVDGVWAQSAAPVATERKHIYTIEDLLESPAVTWSYRTEIIEGLSRSDAISNYEHDLEWLRDNYLGVRPPPRNLKEAKAQEDEKTAIRDTVTATKNLIARADRATVLIHRIRGYDFRNAEEFHTTLMELITIGRSHLIFGFDQFIMWRMRQVFPSCEIPTKGGG